MIAVACARVSREPDSRLSRDPDDNDENKIRKKKNTTFHSRGDAATATTLRRRKRNENSDYEEQGLRGRGVRVRISGEAETVQWQHAFARYRIGSNGFLSRSDGVSIFPLPPFFRPRLSAHRFRIFARGPCTRIHATLAKSLRVASSAKKCFVFGKLTTRKKKPKTKLKARRRADSTRPIQNCFQSSCRTVRSIGTSDDVRLKSPRYYRRRRKKRVRSNAILSDRTFLIATGLVVFSVYR